MVQPAFSAIGELRDSQSPTAHALHVLISTISDASRVTLEQQSTADRLIPLQLTSPPVLFQIREARVWEFVTARM